MTAELDTPALSLDISALDEDDDELVAAAMLCSWTWAAALIDGSAALGRRRNVLRVQDELWKALRVAPGLVERSDRVTRLGRHRGEVSIQVTHSLQDLEALPTEADRAKARGMAARNGVVVLGGLDDHELDRVSRITPLSAAERAMVRGWAAPPTWIPGSVHPGRGKYLIKSGDRTGLPVQLALTGTERRLYDTDRAWRPPETTHGARGARGDGTGGDGVMSDGPGRPPFRLADIAIPLVMLGTGVAATLVAAAVWLAGVLAADTPTVVPAPGVADPAGDHPGRGGGQPRPPDRSRRFPTDLLGDDHHPGAADRRRGRRAGVVGHPSAWTASATWPAHSGAPATTATCAARVPGAGPCPCGPRWPRNRAVARDDIGLRLGRLGRHDLFAAEEDVLLHIAGPRSNKTSALVVPAVLSAPGPLIATSNKVDLHILTCGLRAQVGRVFIFDPQHIAGVAQTWWWNPLAAIRDVSDAHHLVAHFSHTVGAGHERADPYFTKGAERLLAQLCLAAAVSGHHLRDVQHWLATRSDTPVQLLRDAGQHRVATALLGTLEAPPDQRGGLYETALTAIACLESEAVLRYVTPPATWQPGPRVGRIDEFDPWQFLTGYYLDPHGRPAPHDSLYLLTREGAGSAAPVVAALVDHLLRTTATAATACGGRVDPPVRAVLDEAANICPIRNLPDLYSYFGSMSIQVLSFLQSYQQGVHIWGRAGMDKLWSAATVKLIGAGVHDPAFCEDLSRLVGDHDITTWTHQHGRHGHTSTATRPQRILSAADIARLTKTQAVLLSAGRKAGLIRLLPWYTEHDDDAQAIKDHAAEATAQVRDAATAALGPHNPLSRILTATRAPARERHDRRRRHRADRRRRPVAGRPSRADAATRRPRATS